MIIATDSALELREAREAFFRAHSYAAKQAAYSRLAQAVREVGKEAPQSEPAGFRVFGGGADLRRVGSAAESHCAKSGDAIRVASLAPECAQA